VTLLVALICVSSAAAAEPEAPAITSANNTAFTEGVAGSFTVTATGEPTPTITETGKLPEGVTFSEGVLSGTPTQSGTYTITFFASNGVSPEAEQSFTLTVDSAPAITSANKTTFTMGTAGSFTVTATGYPTPTISDGGATLPAGVTFSNGVLSGTPTQGGVYPITFTASNGVSPNATQSFTLTVDAPPLITSVTKTTFDQGVASSFTVTATGTPTPTITEWGNFPSGLKFSGGVLSGTPSLQGIFQLTFTATNGIGNPSVQYFTLTVLGLRITTLSLPTATPGQPYSYQLEAAGGDPPYKWKVALQGLPAGLKLSKTGLISGTVGKKATTVVSGATVTDSSKTDPQEAEAAINLPVS
jgi:hypothetical protein